MNDIVTLAKEYAQTKLSQEGSGHDWWHTFRVWRVAKKISQTEKVDVEIVELGALLHDIDDWKSQEGNNTDIGPQKARQWLLENGASEEIAQHVANIIKEISFKGAGVEDQLNSLEAKVVQDADRLDAIGAIGIARVFTYGGSIGRKIFDPELEPTIHQTFEDYKKSNSAAGTSSINHFYEKLLLLKDRMKTETGSRIASMRHKKMERFLKEFYEEWEGAD